LKDFGGPKDEWKIIIGDPASESDLEFRARNLILYTGATELEFYDIEIDDCFTEDSICSLESAYTVNVTCEICEDGSYTFHYGFFQDQTYCLTTPLVPPVPEHRVALTGAEFTGYDVSCGFGEISNAPGTACDACTDTSCAKCDPSALATCTSCPYDSLAWLNGGTCSTTACTGG
jgi:hypothetical protein